MRDNLQRTRKGRRKKRTRRIRTPIFKDTIQNYPKESSKNSDLGDIDAGVHNRRILNFSLLSKIEAKNFTQASEDKHWVNSMEE
jgi:hypothetical protein